MAVKRLKNRKRSASTQVTEGTVEMREVRPPKVPSMQDHQLNLTRLSISIRCLGVWLGVSTAALKRGDSRVVRVAVQHYLDHQNKVVLARAKKA